MNLLFDEQRFLRVGGKLGWRGLAVADILLYYQKSSSLSLSCVVSTSDYCRMRVCLIIYPKAIGHSRLGARYETCCANAYDATEGHKLPDGPITNIESTNSSILFQYGCGLRRTVFQGAGSK